MQLQRVVSTTPRSQQYSKDYQQQVYGAPLFNNGTAVPLQRDLRPGDDGVPGVRAAVGQHDAARATRSRRRSATRCRARPSTPTCAYYLRLGGSGLLALRGRGFKSWGEAPDFNYFGGNADLRGYEYLQFAGNNDVLCERRAALPADRGDADADWRRWVASAACSSPARRRLLQRFSTSSSRATSRRP